MRGTASAALAMSGYPSTTSAWAAGAGTRRSSACRIVTSVLSLPTSARATSKPCSGSSESRLYPDTRRGICG